MTDPSVRSPHFHIPVKLQSTNGKIQTKALVDSGATTSFVSRRFTEAQSLPMTSLTRPVKVFNIDGSLNTHGSITRFAALDMDVENHSERIRLAEADIGSEDIILGLPWLKKHNPSINWENKTLKLNNCKDKCQRWLIRAVSLYTPDESPLVIDWEIDEERYLLDKEIGIRATSLNEEIKKKAHPTDWFKLIPARYHRFKRVFSEEESQRLPQHQPWDHEINFIPGKDPGYLRLKPYPVPEKWQGEMRKFLDKNLQQGYIRPSKSSYSSPMTFTPKKDGELRPIFDYRRLKDRKSTRLNSSHSGESRMPSSA